MAKWIPRGREKVQIAFLFVLGSALGSPGSLQVIKIEPKGVKMLPRDTKIKVLGLKRASKMCAISFYVLPSVWLLACSSAVAELGAAKWIYIQMYT